MSMVQCAYVNHCVRKPLTEILRPAQSPGHRRHVLIQNGPFGTAGHRVEDTLTQVKVLHEHVN